MNKRQKAALLLAGTLALNTLPGCSENYQFPSNMQENLEYSEKLFRTDNLYIVFAKTMSGEIIPYIIEKYETFVRLKYFDVLTGSTLVRANFQDINGRTCRPLCEYLEVDEMKFSLSREELILICKRLQEKYCSSGEEKLKLSKTNSSNEEKTYNIKNYMISAIKKSSTDTPELYIVDQDGKEIFTEHDFSLVNVTSYNIIDFIGIEDYKEEYTESELREILKYAREKYYNLNNDQSLGLTK